MTFHPYLAGRLEKIKIGRVYKNNCAIANFDGQDILINNASKFVGEECIIRFGLNEKKNSINFIKSRILDGFAGFDAWEYVLVGLWEDGMKKKGQYPTLNEINNYYDPSDMPQAIYFSDNNDLEKGVAITPKEIFEPDGNYERILTKFLPNDEKSSRVVLVESIDDIWKVCDFILKSVQYIVLMQPIKPVQNYNQSLELKINDNYLGKIY